MAPKMHGSPEQAASSSSASADDRFAYLSNQIYDSNDAMTAAKNSVVFPSKIHFPKTSRRLPQVCMCSAHIVTIYLLTFGRVFRK